MVFVLFTWKSVCRFAKFIMSPTMSPVRAMKNRAAHFLDIRSRREGGEDGDEEGRRWRRLEVEFCRKKVA